MKHRAPFLQSVWAILWKDLAAELRSRELFSGMFIFALLVIVIFNFAMELDVATRRSVTAGVLWTTFFFAGTIGLSRSMAMEKDRGSLDGLLLAPVDRAAIYFGKMLGNLLFMLLVEALILPLYSFLYNQNLFNGGLFLVILLGSLGYVAVGTLLASMSIQARTRDLLLPILLFPVLLPLVIGAVKASGGYLSGAAREEILPFLNLLLAYDVIFLSVSYMLFDYVIEE